MEKVPLIDNITDPLTEPLAQEDSQLWGSCTSVIAFSPSKRLITCNLYMNLHDYSIKLRH